MKKPITSYYLFVYGSLQSFRSDILNRMPGAVCVGYDTTAEWKFAMYDLGEFPAVTTGGHYPVSGELWIVPASSLPDIDRYEGYPNLYTRIHVPLLKLGSPALMYIMETVPSHAIDVDPIGGSLVW